MSVFEWIKSNGRSSGVGRSEIIEEIIPKFFKSRRQLSPEHKSEIDAGTEREIGLTGDLRAVQNAEKIIREAERLGFERVVLPIKNARHIKSKPDINVIGLKNIAEARNLF